MVYAQDEPAERVKVYCFSADLEAGFKDEVASFFCSKFEEDDDWLILTDKESAQVTVEFLGIQEITAPGNTTYLLGGYAWTPDQHKNGVRSVLSIGDFKKGFYGEGINAVAIQRNQAFVSVWIRDNREAILAKAKGKKN